MPQRSAPSARTRAFWAVTIALGLAYLFAALGLARPGEVADFGWLNRFDTGASLWLVLAVLYGGAALVGRRASRPQRPRAGWRGAAYGVLALLAIIVLVGSWNAGLELLAHTSHRTTPAEFGRQLGEACYDYIGKPLGSLLPLGSLVVGPLGWWVGRRAGSAPA